MLQEKKLGRDEFWVWVWKLRVCAVDVTSGGRVFQVRTVASRRRVSGILHTARAVEYKERKCQHARLAWAVDYKPGTIVRVHFDIEKRAQSSWYRLRCTKPMKTVQQRSGPIDLDNRRLRGYEHNTVKFTTKAVGYGIREEINARFRRNYIYFSLLTTALRYDWIV